MTPVVLAAIPEFTRLENPYFSHLAILRPAESLLHNNARFWVRIWPLFLDCHTGMEKNARDKIFGPPF